MNWLIRWGPLVRRRFKPRRQPKHKHKWQPITGVPFNLNG